MIEPEIKWAVCHITKFKGAGPTIQIQDDCECFCATIPREMSSSQMCRAFARTYDYGVNDEPIACCWSVWDYKGEEGDQTNSGSFRFQAGGELAAGSWNEKSGFCFRIQAYCKPTPEAHGFALMN